FAFDLLRPFHEIREALQTGFEHAAEFTGFDHVEVKAVEDLWILAQRFAERAAALDRKAEARNDLFKRQMGFLFVQQAQAAQQRHARFEQRGELPRENLEAL